MSYFTMGYQLPYFISKQLFGDRKKFGLIVKPEDPCWKEWEVVTYRFYQETQKQNIGQVVNDAGYRVMQYIDLSNKTVLEVGPGQIQHHNYWKGIPKEYTIADVRGEMLAQASKTLELKNVPYKKVLIDRMENGKLPFKDDFFEVIISFYSLEHLYPLQPYIEDIHRILKPGGVFIGAIPCEGGIGWGLGRFLTSRRWLKTNSNINPDKIICWEHPNFADEILSTMDSILEQKKIEYWPFFVQTIDFNLVAKFIYVKKSKI